jgi:tellurite resistance protein TehA-like permease
MEIAYLHLVTNHIPIIGVPFALAILLWGLWRNSDELKTTGFLAFALLGVATIGVFLLGQGGEDFIEDLPGVSHDAIEAHEEFATFALVCVLVVAATSVLALLRYRFLRAAPAESSPVFPRWVVLLVLALSLGSAATLGYTGRLGGKIRHPEFHTDQASGTEIEDAGTGAENGGGRKRGRNRSER